MWTQHFDSFCHVASWCFLCHCSFLFRRGKKLAFAVIVFSEDMFKFVLDIEKLKGYMIIKKKEFRRDEQCNRLLMTQRRIPPAVAVRMRKFRPLQEPIRLQDLLNSARSRAEKKKSSDICLVEPLAYQADVDNCKFRWRNIYIHFWLDVFLGTSLSSLYCRGWPRNGQRFKTHAHSHWSAHQTFCLVAFLLPLSSWLV